MRRSDVARRAAAARALRASHQAEQRYVRDLKAILRGVHRTYMAYLEPRIADVATATKREDARITKHSGDLDLLGVHVVTQVAAHVRTAFDRMSGTVNKANAKANATLLGIRPSDTRIGPQINAARDRNIALVENAARVYAQQVREVFEDPDSYGLSPDELKARLLDRADVSESRAELIARDQTLKLNGEMNQTRQENAGVSEYVWSTSQDERVRETHAELEGETFSWSSPPDVGHPGEDYQCRCTALPVIDELEGI